MGGKSTAFIFKKGEVMRLTIKLNLDTLIATAFTNNFYLAFDDITNLENWYDSDEQPHVSALEFQQASIYKTMYVFLNGGTNPDYDERDGDIEDLSASTYIKFTCTINNSSYAILQDFISKGIIEIDQDGKTSLFAYRLNDEKDKITKSLTFVTAFEGTFKAPLGIKNIELDVVDYDIENSYNYVYIPKLKRYYYVINITLTTKDYTRLQLQEDVLMSWKDLIKLQSAYVTRYENSTILGLVDNRRPVQDIITVAYYTTLSTVTGVSIVNTYLDGNPNTYNILVSTIASNDVQETKTAVSTPAGSYLPQVNGTIAETERITFITKNQYNLLFYANKMDSETASFVNTILWLPFNPVTPFSLSTMTPIYANDKFLYNTLIPSTRWVDIGSHTPDIEGYDCKLGASPYLIVAHFTFNTSGGVTLQGSYLDYEPYSNYEIYVPFVGWQSVQLKDVKDGEIIVYYVVDLHSGDATAYIYNCTTRKTIWSGTCKIGLMLPVTNTNSLELQKQQQANSTNMILSMLGSALSIGVGVMAKNPVAIAGGVMGGTKAIAHNVNQNLMMFDKAVTSFGSGDGAIHSPLAVAVRKSYHIAITQTESVYKHLNGLPYNSYQVISTLSGYIEIGDIHFDAKGYNIYSSEIDEIVALLKNGVII